MHFIKSFLFAIPLAVVNLTPSACAQGVCNIYGCSSCGECSIYGCPQCGGSNSNYGGYDGYGGYGGYGGYDGYGGYGGYGGNSSGSSSGGAKQICNIYGCGVSPNIYGASPNGVCTIYGCP